MSKTMSDGSRVYELSCTDCTFATRFEGAIDEVYDLIEDHQDEVLSDYAEHFVEFEVIASDGPVGAD